MQVSDVAGSNEIGALVGPLSRCPPNSAGSRLLCFASRRLSAPVVRSLQDMTQQLDLTASPPFQLPLVPFFGLYAMLVNR
jgi:hypothetical protein